MKVTLCTKHRNTVEPVMIVVVVVFRPRPMKGMGCLQFSDIFTELPVPPQAAGAVGTF